MRTLSSLTAVLFLLIAAPAGAAVSTNQSGWLWGTPEPQGNALAALELQGTTGYAAGEFGTLLRTNDGGTTWGTVRTGLSLNFTEMDVIDGDSIVVASECAMRRTDNGGKTFRRLPFTSSERQCSRRLLGLSFPTADVGYLLLDGGGLLRTGDGGRSFSTRTVPGGSGFVTALMFRNADEGLAATSVGDIFKTTNGGSSWTREFDGDGVLNGVLFTDTRAVVVGSGGRFIISADGGDTWTRPASAPGAPAPPDAEFRDVRCASATVCLVSAFFPGHLYRTTDGGRSFTLVDLPTVLAVDFASATRAVTVGFGGETHLSNDGGASFSQLGSRIESVDTTLSRVRATSTRVAHAIGESGAVIRTTDGGETWANVGVPTGTSLADLWFPTASVGYALDFAGGLFRTENGGGSWSILDTGAKRVPSGVFAPDGSHVYLIGPRGVLRSNDGGETFERHTHRVIRNRTLVEADQAGSAVVFYGPRAIALSRNDGDTWKHIARPTRSEVRHVDFVSSRAGYVLEQSGRVYFTRNRGRTWTELIGTGYTNGQRLAFGTRRNGWLDIGSSHPAVLHTTDGGKSWTPQILGPQQTIGIAAAGKQTGFATLRSATHILFTDAGGEAGADSRLTLSDRVVPRGGKFALRGRLSPAEGGEDVEVRVRPLNGRRWREIDVTPNKRGKFSFEQRIRRAMVFVAQWEGDADSDGDGSRPLVVQVGG
jgi:photosystem II stability/assembly factor-like uncharacterized protein